MAEEKKKNRTWVKVLGLVATGVGIYYAGKKGWAEKAVTTLKSGIEKKCSSAPAEQPAMNNNPAKNNNGGNFNNYKQQH